jgi:hypothetical protein
MKNLRLKSATLAAVCALSVALQTNAGECDVLNQATTDRLTELTCAARNTLECLWAKVPESVRTRINDGVTKLADQSSEMYAAAAQRSNEVYSVAAKAAAPFYNRAEAKAELAYNAAKSCMQEVGHGAQAVHETLMNEVPLYNSATQGAHTAWNKACEEAAKAAALGRPVVNNALNALKKDKIAMIIVGIVTVYCLAKMLKSMKGSRTVIKPANTDDALDAFLVSPEIVNACAETDEEFRKLHEKFYNF